MDAFVEKNLQDHVQTPPLYIKAAILKLALDSLEKSRILIKLGTPSSQTASSLGAPEEPKMVLIQEKIRGRPGSEGCPTSRNTYLHRYSQS